MQPRGVGRGWGGPCGCLPPPKSCVLEEGKDHRCERGAKWRCRRWHQAPRCDPLPMDNPAAVPLAAGGLRSCTPRVGSPFFTLAFGLSLPCLAAGRAGGVAQRDPRWVHFLLRVLVTPRRQSLAAGGRMAGARPDTGTGSGGGLGAPGARGAPSPGLAEPPWCPSSSRRWDGALPAPPSRHPSLGDARWHWDRTGPWLPLRRASRGDPAAAPPPPCFALYRRLVWAQTTAR